MSNSTNFFTLIADFENNVEWLNKVLLGDENTTVIINGIHKPSISKDIEDKWAAISAIVHGGRIVFETRAALLASGNPPSGVLLAEVWQDAVAENNGLYGWTGSVWEKSQYDSIEKVESEIRKTNELLEDTRGVSFPGPSEFFETVDIVYNAKIQLHDKSRKIIAEIYGDEVREKDIEGVVTYDDLFESIQESQARTLLLIDRDNKIIFEFKNDDIIINELAEARGNNSSLNERISKTITDYGLNDNYFNNGWYLRETRQRLRKLILKKGGKLTIAAIGDSWVHGGFWTQPVFDYLSEVYGFSGVGWVGFSWGFGDFPEPVGLNGNVDPSAVKIAIIGSWTTNYAQAPMPDCCSIVSSAADDSISVTINRLCHDIKLFFVPSNGVITYSYNDGNERVAQLQGNGILQLVSPPHDNSFKLEISVVSGSVELSGIYATSNNDGIIFNKLGATGSSSDQWGKIVSNPLFIDSIKTIKPDLVSILFGTNDQGRLISKRDFKNYLYKIIDNVRMANSYSDILLIAPCANGRESEIPMSVYQEAMQETAYEKKAAFINLQKVFGETYEEYGHLSERKWLGGDLIHPSKDGSLAIADSVLRLTVNN